MRKMILKSLKTGCFFTGVAFVLAAKCWAGTVVFEKLGEVSGVEVIGWRNAPPVEPDADLKILLEQSGTAFGKALATGLSTGGKGKQATEESLRNNLGDPAYVLRLSRHEVFRLAGATALDEVLGRREGREFLARFLSSQEWMDDFLVTWPFRKGTGASVLHALCSIFRYDKESTLPLYRKLACAYARRSGGGDWQDGAFHFRLLDQFQAQKKGHQAGQLHGSFDRLESWEMFHTTAHIGDSRSTKYLLEQVNYPRRRYYGACWTLAYRRSTPFGDSIHGPHYYPPWANEYIAAPLKHKVGGVCGTLSNYGVALARIHGVPAFAVGQPGHCAYMIRHDDQAWGTAYSVTGNTGAGSLFGGGDESIVRLMQAAYDNKSRSRLLKACRHDWQARFFERREAPVLKNPRVRIYSGVGSKRIPDFDKLEPVKTLASPVPEILPHLKGMTGWIGAVLEAEFVLKAEARLSFAITSNDGSRLSVNGKTVVDNDGNHRARKREKTVTLPAGTHHLRIDYYDFNAGRPVCYFEITKAPGREEMLARDLSIKALPLHLNHWKWKARRMAQDPRIKARDWLEFSREFIRVFHLWQRPCWEFLSASILPRLESLPPREHASMILDWHKGVRITKKSHHIGGRLASHIQKQTAPFKTSSQKTAVFRALLARYNGTRYLPTVIGWGRKALAARPEGAPLFLKTLRDFAKKDPGASKGLERTFGDIILDAEQRGDAKTLAATSRLAMELYRERMHKFLHFANAKQMKGFPKETKRYQGRLLSAKAVPTVSRPLDNLTALCHHAALQPDRAGLLISAKQAAPSITVKLPGKCKLSGIAAMTRFENATCMARVLPLLVSVSPNGKKWTKVFETKEARPLYEIDLAKTAPEALYIRFERADKKRVDYFTLRGIRIYGKPLY